MNKLLVLTEQVNGMLKKFHLKHDEAEEDWLGMYGAAQLEIQQEAAAKNDDADPLAAARPRDIHRRSCIQYDLSI